MGNKLVSGLINKNSNKFSFSLEIVPPKHGGNVADILNRLEGVVKYNPLWINVTKHATEKHALNNFSINKSPDNIGLCVLIQERFKILSIPHLLCNGYTKEETEDYLIDIHFLGLNNVLALQGDSVQKLLTNECNIYATDLIEQIQNMNSGKYLKNTLSDVKTNFHVGVAFYPEKHKASKNLDEDIQYFIKKQNTGASFALGQMCFNNNHFYNWKQKATLAGLNIPAIMGLKIITKTTQIKNIENKFGIVIPDSLKTSMANSKNESKTGIEFSVSQIKDLMDNGHYHHHFYVMNNFESLYDVLREFV